MLSALRVYARDWRRADSTPLSLRVRADAAPAPAGQTQFSLLVRHLLDRFFNNDMLSTGGEALPLIMTVAGVIAVPTLIAAIFLYFPYHAFPPKPPVPGFWSQVSEHYFFAMYSFVAMGAITVFEADLLFPNRVDILILSSLPIPNRTLVGARVSAVLIFLVLFLLGVNLPGAFTYPPATELHVRRLFVAHMAAVLASGTFAASLFLAIQGVLICIFSGRIYRAASAILQGLSTAALLSILLLFPSLSRSLAPLMHSSSAALRYFPPLWFLGIYESVLAGAARLPVFAQLARTGCWATAAAVLVAAATYPLAYRRRTREAIEGLGSRYEKNRFGEPLRWLLHATVLGSSSRRAVFHFIGQTLRIPRHRIYLSMYAGLGIALMVACSAVLQVEHGHLRFSVAPYALRLAVPGVAFWTVAGLCTSLDSPADAGAGWVFRLIDDRPTQDQRDAVLIWVTLWATAITLAAVALLGWMDSSALRTPWQIIGTILMVTGLCVLLTDAFLLQSKTIPFTESRIPLNTDLAFVVLRYIVLFPCVVWIAMQWEPWIQSGPVPLAVTAIAIAALHQGLRQVNLQLAAGRLIRPEIDPQHGLIHTLGLRE